MGIFCLLLFALICVYNTLQYKKIRQYINELEYDIEELKTQISNKESKKDEIDN